MARRPRQRARDHARIRFVWTDYRAAATPPPKTTRYFLWAGSAFLAVTGMFHGSEWPGVAAAADEASLSPLLSAIVKSLWIYA